MPFSIHRYEDTEFELSFFEESNGTQSAYALLGLLLPALQTGGVAIIDELDNDLHPHLLPVIIDLFRSQHSNPHNAQLIFSCHTPEVFNLLHKHQIYLVEKYQQKSEAWRLDDVEGVRNDDNLYAKYMAGAFDAVPNV
ncbi:AAA family ATPase [Psychrobacter sp. I-STPA10]|uniref:AAA family ATPase n=1 Tax=Psychrobacter sp. I-STPA10 TaxID=2585769 RepID=UPI001E339B67|nr:AAA family ATPase [Psychrobacter sp. I-STPA10]